MGGTEDADLHTRLWKAGKKGLYIPELFLYHKVEPHRLTKHYHRKWHTGHGAYYAIMREESIEESTLRLFDIPGCIFNESASSFFRMFALLIKGRRDEAFLYETKLHFGLGFMRQRFTDFRTLSSSSIATQIFSTTRSVFTRITGYFFPQRRGDRAK